MLRRSYVGSLRPFLTVFDIEGYSLPLIKGLEPIHIDRAEMDEIILFIFPGNKTIPLSAVKPFDSSFVQNVLPPNIFFCRHILTAIVVYMNHISMSTIFTKFQT